MGIFTHFFLSLFIGLTIASIPSSIVWAQDDQMATVEKFSDKNLDSTKEKENLRGKLILHPDQLLKVVSLRSVIEEGLRANLTELQRQYEKKIFTLEEDTNYDKFWFPQLKFVFKTDQQRIFNFISKDDAHRMSKTPQGKIGFEIGEFTVFNWGKDYLDYQVAQDTLKRKKQQLYEKRRELKHDLIVNYFRLVFLRKIQQINKNHLRHSSFAYRITREKKSVRKTTEEELLQTRSLYLKAQKLFNEARNETYIINKQLAYLLKEPTHTLFRPIDKLKFQKIMIEFEDARKISRMNNPTVLDQKIALQNANHILEKTYKENLPLPKFSINFGGYMHTFSTEGADTKFDTSFTDGPGGKNIDLQASINFTWTLWGGDGTFNERVRQKAFYEKKLYQAKLEDAYHQSEILIRQYLKNLRLLEKRYDFALLHIENAQSKFDVVLDNYLKKKSPYLNLEEALLDLKEAEEKFELIKFEHLLIKIALAKLLGIEDFPGEDFEKLAIKDEE